MFSGIKSDLFSNFGRFQGGKYRVTIIGSLLEMDNFYDVISLKVKKLVT